MAILVVGLVLMETPGLTSAQQEVCDTPTQPIEATDIVAALQRGEKKFFTGYVVNGSIDLTDFGALEVPLIINHSTINGDVIVPLVKFAERVDISCTTIKGSLYFRGAVFESDVILNRTKVQSIHASGARFGQTFSMLDAIADAEVSFHSAVFSEFVTAENSVFFGEVDFNRARFEQDALFSNATFTQRARFMDMVAEADVDFRLAQFYADSLFSGASVAGSLDLTGSVIFLPSFLKEIDTSKIRPPDYCCLVNFDRIKATSLLLDDAIFNYDEGVLRINELEVEDIEMHLDLTDVIRGDDDDETAVLDAIEMTSRDDGRIEDANNAAFKRHVTEHRREGSVWRAGWWAGGEQIAGYLVKPLRPLRAMLIVGGLAAVARLLAALLDKTREERGDHKADETKRMNLVRRLARFGSSLASIGNYRKWFAGIWSVVRGAGDKRWWFARSTSAIAAAVTVAIFPKPPQVKIGPIESATPGHLVGLIGRWGEWVVQKGLNAAFVLALGNAVPAIKDVIDSVGKV